MNSNTKSAIRNYLTVGTLCCIVAVSAFHMEQPADLVFFKVIIAPVFWLALQGLEGIFRSPVYEKRFTLRALEYSALSTFLWMMFGIFISWNNQFEVARMLVSVPIIFILGTVFIMWLGLRRSAA